MQSKEIIKCQACNSKTLYKFIDFGLMPKPNIYLNKKQVGEQTTYQLGANLCTNCGLVQLDRIVPSEELFAKEYAYVTPEAMRKDFREGVKETVDIFGGIPKRVLEIGGGISIPLQEYKRLGVVDVVGVDPAPIVAKKARKLGIKMVIKPFTLKLAEEMDKFNIITASNVLQHIPDIKGTFEGIKQVLADDGIFVLEFPYLGDILDDLAFDTFYAEHYYYLSLTALQNIFNSLEMTIFYAKRLPDIHCGSMRIWVRHNPRSQSVTLPELVLKEKGFIDTNLYDLFRRRIDDNMHQLQEHLYIAKARGDRIVAHGASAKFVTLTNYGHIGSDLIEYVADNTVYKQGKFTPGMGIPVVSEEKLIEDAPDVIVCGIRNFYQQSKPLYDRIKKINPKTKILIPIPEVVYK